VRWIARKLGWFLTEWGMRKPRLIGPTRARPLVWKVGDHLYWWGLGKSGSQ
jgi:hypothetical protein